MARSGLGESGTKPQQSSPPATVAADRRSRSLSVRGGERAGADEVAMVRRSSIAPCVSCGLCGGPLRDATTASECLHSFCRKCISENFKDEDDKRCPTCNIDLGCDPKLRADRSLQCISSVLFPAKRHKMEECSSLHPELVLLPPLTPGADGPNLSVYKMNAYLVDEPMNIDTLSSAVDITAAGRSALPQVASQRESQKNTAKMLESIEVYTGGTKALEAEKVGSREEFENERAQSAAACERTKFVEERFQREFEMSQQSTKALGVARAADAAEAPAREESRLLREERDAFRRERDIARVEALCLRGERDEALAAGAVARRDLEATRRDQAELEDQCKALQDSVCDLRHRLEKEMGHCQRLELALQAQAEEYDKPYSTGMVGFYWGRTGWSSTSPRCP